MNPYPSANKAYTEASVMTAPPARLVVMLYDGMIRFLMQAASAMREGDRAQMHDRLRRAQAIIDELNVCLDMGQGEIPTQLRAIYLFCKRHLGEAHLHNDVAAIDDVVKLLSDLRESWVELAARVGDADPRTTAAV